MRKQCCRHENCVNNGPDPHQYMGCHLCQEQPRAHTCFCSSVISFRSHRMNILQLLSCLQDSWHSSPSRHLLFGSTSDTFFVILFSTTLPHSAGVLTTWNSKQDYASQKGSQPCPRWESSTMTGILVVTHIWVCSSCLLPPLSHSNCSLCLEQDPSSKPTPLPVDIYSHSTWDVIFLDINKQDTRATTPSGPSLKTCILPCISSCSLLL